MSEAEPNKKGSAFLDRLRRAVEHAEGAVGCYLALLGKRVEHWTQERAGDATRFLRFFALWVIAIVFVLCGIAEMLDEVLPRKGTGKLCMGAAVLLILLGAKLLRKDRGERR